MCSLADALGRDVQDSRDFRDREPLDLPQDERGMVQLVELTQRVADAFPQVARVERDSRERRPIRVGPGS